LRALFGWLTIRGKSFVALGGAAIVCGLAIPDPDLVRVGALLVILPTVSALTARRSRYHLSCSHRLHPPRVPAGQPATVTARAENISRRRTGVLVAEDVIPHTLGSRPPFLLDEIEPGGSRELSYEIRSEVRGTFTIGPLRVRVADAFGLVEIGRSFGTTGTLVVTPKIYPLPRATAPSNWFGGDDTAPRVYQDGDSLHRVHWKSTARHGQLMVRREEHRRRTSASVFLDTRRSAHSGGGASGTFEFAVSAAASVGAHLTGEGFRVRLITEAGEIASRGAFSGTPLDMLAVITPSRAAGFGMGTSALASAGGQLIAVMGRLSAEDASALAATRRGSAPAMALLLDVSSWTSDPISEDSARTTEILIAAGWRVAVASATTPLAAAWQQLHRPADRPLLVGSTGGFLRPAGTRGSQGDRR
jgi:uncharacterized protein (DUF58 family)